MGKLDEDIGVKIEFHPGETWWVVPNLVLTLKDLIEGILIEGKKDIYLDPTLTYLALRIK
jgi:hypothetical protein